MAFAVERLSEIGGGIVAVEDLGVVAECPLPIAGLLSDARLPDVIAQSRACNEAAHALGWTGATPFLTLSFLALSVIPQLKITDRGLVDVDRFELVPLRGMSPRSRRQPSAEPGSAGREPKAAGGVRRLFAGGWIVTCDDAGTEYADGWVLVEDGFVADVGAGEEPEADERIDARRRRRHARARQHAPPPVPDSHPRPGAAVRPLQLAPRAVPGVGRTSTPSRSMRPHAQGLRSSRSRAARPSSTTTTSSHADARGSSRPRWRQHASSACASSPRAGRWTSASPTAGSRPTSSSRSSTQCSRTPSVSWASCTSPAPAHTSRSPSPPAHRSP